MSIDSNHITLVGCGNMGGALLQGWLKSSIKASYTVIEPKGLPDVFKGKVTHLQTPDESIKKSGLIILAVKPQMMNEACANLKPFVFENALLLSIAAGFSMASFEKIFGAGQPIVRTMPNLPASIGKGASVAFANKNVSAGQRARADELLRSAGMVEWLSSETLINSATALQGNGPAYVFYLIEVLTQAGIKNGLDEATAKKLARQTVIGGAALAEANPGADPATLRKNVTSPSGTTEAALKVLMNGEMQRLFDEALAAGKKRAEELAS